MVTAMWSVSNRTGTSNSKSPVTSTPAAGAVPKVPARRPGEGRLTPIEDAPGSYARVRAV